MFRFLFSLVALLLGVIIFLPQKAYASLNITNVSPNVINSADDQIIITASASGLQNSTQYLEGLFTKDGEASNYFGLSLNQKGEWYQYKPSPTTSDLSSYFFNFIPVSGTWSGQLIVKLDVSDAGFKGPGNYSFKLAKFITSSASFSNTASITVNVTPTPTPTPTSNPSPASTSTNTPSPTVDLTYSVPKTNTPTPTPVPKITLSPFFYEKASSASFPDYESVDNISSHGSVFAKESSKEVLGISDVNSLVFAFGGGLLIIAGISFIFFKHFKSLEN